MVKRNCAKTWRRVCKYLHDSLEIFYKAFTPSKTHGKAKGAHFLVEKSRICSQSCRTDFTTKFLLDAKTQNNGF